MIRRIQTAIELSALSDLSAEWKIAAIRDFSDPLGWQWCGTVTHDVRAFRSGMFPMPGDSPRISCATGRDAAGCEVLYARLYPTQLREARR
jgi:hypothetical protein